MLAVKTMYIATVFIARRSASTALPIVMDNAPVVKTLVHARVLIVSKFLSRRVVWLSLLLKLLLARVPFMVLPRVQAIVLAMIVIGVVDATFATESTVGSVTNASSVPQFTVMVNVVVNDVVCANALLLVLVLSVVSVSVLAKLFIQPFVLLIVLVPSVWIKISCDSS